PRGENERLPDIGSFAELRTLDSKKWNRKFETRRHYADDGEAATVRDNFPSDNLWVAIVPVLPQPFTDDQHVVVSSRAIGRLEDASANRHNAENIKKICGTDRAEDAFGTITARKIERLRLKQRHVVETSAGRLIFDEF